jgi:penicillin-binding protein 1C
MRISNRFKRRVALAIAVPLATAILCAAAFHLTVVWIPYSADADIPLAHSTWIVDHNGDPLASFASGSGQWSLPLNRDEISPHLFDAVIATEDARFFQHGGVDWHSVATALMQDLAARGPRRGASTISMQLFRLRQPAPRSIAAKLMQAIRASQIERESSKQDILIEYVNRAPMGGNLVGAGAASWRYFGRACGDLSLGQAALLAGLPQSPNRLRPDRFPDRARLRRDHVLQRMLACGMIDEAQRAQAAAEPIDASWRPLPQEAPQNRGLAPTLLALASHFPGGVIRTHLDPTIQKQASEVALESLNSLSSSGISAASVVVLDTPSAHCLAAISLTLGKDAKGSAIDLTTRPRSSGSTLKPFIYAAAFDAGICSPQTIVDDSPAAWAGYEPRNYDRDFLGAMTAADALAESRNIPALVLLSKLGVEHAAAVMGAMGLSTLARTPQRYGLPLAIGGAEVTPIELAQAYATLARGGKFIPAKMVDDAQIESSLIQPSVNNVSLEQAPTTLLKKLIRANTLRPSSCQAALYCIANPARTEQLWPAAASLSPAWKTGTSSGHRDAWCAAVTPRRTVVVWLGNVDESGSDALVGTDAAAPLALKILTACDKGGTGFAPPDGFRTSRPAEPSIPQSAMEHSLTMLSPIDGQEIVRDPAIPMEHQRLELRGQQIGNPTSDLWWFIDGDPVGHVQNGATFWWTPSTGYHAIRVVAGDGKSASANIRVR